MDDSSSTAKVLIAALTAQAHVSVVTLFGSRARAEDDSGADVGSDYDLQVVTSRPAHLLAKAWAEAAVGADQIQGWSVRDASGGAAKLTILLVDTEVDLVLVPIRRMRLARWGVKLGLHRRYAWARRQLEPLVLVMGRGYRILKGGAEWEAFWLILFRDIPEPRLSDDAVRNLGQRAQVDLVSIQRKLERGELCAAQRWLHTGLAETNFQLMHEWRRRRGEGSFHDARRVESLLRPDELAMISISAELNRERIETAATHAAQVADRLVAAVLGLPAVSRD